MIGIADMERTARAYLRAARILNRKASGSPGVAVYLCGYAVEIALKVCVCRSHGLAGWPETPPEFSGQANSAHLRASQLRTHNLDDLLALVGPQTAARIRSAPATLVEWSTVRLWRPEQRYWPVGRQTAADAGDMIEATKTVLRALL